MTKARALDKRRNSIRGIRKITRTMELIATAQFRKAMNRALSATAYTNRITTVVGDLARAGLEISHPLLESRTEPQRALLLVLTANRGMCGGYNSSVLRLAHARLAELRKEIPEVALEVSGKRGISAFRFRGVEPEETFTHFEDKPSLDEVDVLAGRYLDDYKTGQLDRLDVVYTEFESLNRHDAVARTLLPIAGTEWEKEAHEPAHETEYEFFPSAESILEEVIPSSFRARLMKCFLDAAASEQVTRMIAMKAATENADSMISHLTMAYNRVRQGQITNDLLEVIGGANAMEQ